MNSRLLLAMLIAVVPISVEMGSSPDTTRRAAADSRPREHETRIALAGDAAQFSIIRRGCEGQVVDRANAQVRSGALEVEHVFPSDFVIGARGGKVREKLGAFVNDTSPGNVEHGWRDNAFVGGYLGVDNRSGSLTVGYLHSDHGFHRPEARPFHPEVSVRILGRNERGWAAVRFMDDMPLETGGYLTTEVGAHVNPRVDLSGFLGLIGPYDGTMIGLKGRVWLTPEAALTLRGGVAGSDEYTAGAGLEARFGKH